MDNIERLINAGGKLTAASIQRVRDLKDKPIEGEVLAAATDGIERKTNSGAVAAWLRDEGGKGWTDEFYGFKNGRVRPIESENEKGKSYTDGLSEVHRRLLGRILAYVGRSVERGLGLASIEEPSETQRAAVEGDNKATFRNGAHFVAAWEWVEDVGHAAT